MMRMQTYIGTTTIAGRSAPGGYGFGLRLFDDHELGMLIAHSGGVPGYGSNMRWARRRGLAVIALANVTYAPMNDLTLRMLTAVHAAGALPAAEPQRAPLVERAAEQQVALLNDWTDDAADELFADNVAPDESFERRRAEAHRLIAAHGELRVVAVRPASAARGHVDLHGRGPAGSIELELGPATPPRVQRYVIHPPSAD
jgi:hypothetical protein